VEDQLTVKVIEGSVAGDINVILRDNMGRPLYNSKATFDESGLLHIDFKEKAISSGLFMLEISYDGGERKVFRLIKK
jgi:hypothetical protein